MHGKNQRHDGCKTAENNGKMTAGFGRFCRRCAIEQGRFIFHCSLRGPCATPYLMACMFLLHGPAHKKRQQEFCSCCQRVKLRCLYHFLEHGFVNAAYRASPVVRQICKSCSGSDTVLRITFCGIISVTTGIAKILVHSRSPFHYVFFY